MFDLRNTETMVGQMATPTPSLATVLSRWIRAERLRPMHFVAGGISRGHLRLMLAAKPVRPDIKTLRKVARVVATDPDGKVDRLKYDTVLRELAVAAGHDDLLPRVAESELEAAIAGYVTNPQVADFYHEIIKTYPDLTPAHQQIVRAVLAMAYRPGGDDVTALFTALADASRAPQTGGSH